MSKLPNKPVPDDQVSDDQEPEAQVPESLEPDNQVSDNQVSDDQVSNDQEPEAQVPESLESDDQVSDDQEPEAKVPEDLEPDSQVPDSQVPFKQILEGAILAADKPLSIDALIQLFGEHEQPSRADVKLVLAEIQTDFEDRGFELKEVASGFRFQVKNEFSQWIDKLWAEKAPRYTRAFLETLALIAYKQPITRGDIEEIRGVSVSTNIMRSLLEREWIRVVGHRDVPGRPAIYATTKTFLDYFDLSSLDQLPTLSEIKDLDKMNEELDLGVEDLIQPRSLDLEIEDTEAASDAADDDVLNSVIEKVNTIQENIKNVMRDPVDEEELDEEELAEEELDSEHPDQAEVKDEKAEIEQQANQANSTEVESLSTEENEAEENETEEAVAEDVIAEEPEADEPVPVKDGHHDQQNNPDVDSDQSDSDKSGIDNV